MKVLLVEDDAALGAEIAKALRAESFALDHARDGEDAQHLGETEDYDAVVLDLGLPKRDGVSVLQAWRAAGRTLPVLILTARDGWSDKVAGFKAGADDYLVKPFRTEELVIRLRALVRRAQASGASRLVCGPLSFDPGLGAFERDGLPLKLTGLEWRVLSCLMLRKDAVVPRLQLIERVYDGDADVDSNSVEVIITRLRRKIAPAQIEAVRGHGWRLHADAA
ncbi:response regulator transcription factor [Methylobacterium sp. E-041]|jgi:two-component system OmpR family response regulator|uniref:response regulator n=1 Tax=unclassified Methylobacterium TaxID=2615210 RepID=UPI0011C8F769|nr:MULTISPECIES: response regulator transcription factor [unclassified Methylobacterium]RZK94204.1 MAG: response regulator transcription factor [Methylobacterium sp.]MCJ2038920.1 response regulator transcription factor [Methylobacterium sp. J-059]MCJ2078636.1 response regulator transcription factor [Methylobacterium sp. E-016]MCJ2108750.1 response regulator transcription factor [Methylobacterium sp. E-041]MCJ2110745.1 response regulator transcription factor [Methylobacterium sp. E-025]